MNRVKKLYGLVSDDDGHNYLVPNSEYDEWYKKLSEKERALNNYIEDYSELDYDLIDALQDEIYECYNDLERLEGEEYCVVLLCDIVD